MRCFHLSLGRSLRPPTQPATAPAAGAAATSLSLSQYGVGNKKERYGDGYGDGYGGPIAFLSLSSGWRRATATATGSEATAAARVSGDTGRGRGRGGSRAFTTSSTSSSSSSSTFGEEKKENTTTVDGQLDEGQREGEKDVSRSGTEMRRQQTGKLNRLPQVAPFEEHLSSALRRSVSSPFVHPQRN